MLDRPALLHEVSRLADRLFVDRADDSQEISALWRTMARDPLFVHKAAAYYAPDLIVPLWQGQLDKIDMIGQPERPPIVVAVDGSQIYPDRHQGTACYLINIGYVRLAYRQVEQRVMLASRPHLFTPDYDRQDAGTQESINCKRHELELQAAFEWGQQADLVFLDGSLIFWHLEAQDSRMKDLFLPVYVDILEQFCAQRILLACYISMPRSRELVNLIRLHLRLSGLTAQEERLSAVVDAHVVNLFLSPGERTTVFMNRSTISQFYPASSRPYFFYLHGGDEIGRVEIPAWIAADEALVDAVAAMTLDQIRKGYGYPVALAEAHEQAVIKGPDREFFYHALSKIGIEQKRRLLSSCKSQKKRRIGI